MFTGCEDDFSTKSIINDFLPPNSNLTILPGSICEKPTFQNQSSVGGGSSKPLPRGGHAIVSSSKHHNTQHNLPLQHFHTGLKSFDEICCSTGMSSQQLENHLAKDKHVIVLLK